VTRSDSLTFPSHTGQDILTFMWAVPGRLLTEVPRAKLRRVGLESL
jgi:hypothetical protein